MLVVVMPAPALAGTQAQTTTEFSVAGGNGYSIAVAGKGQQMTLIASRIFEIASYTVQGHATQRSMRARFGHLGRIDVEFRPSGSLTRRVPPGRCAGRPRITRFGTFVGTIRFSGEHGYTKVESTRARGSVYVHRKWRCEPERHGHEPSCLQGVGGPEESIVLGAESRSQRRGFVAFADRSREERGATAFMASSAERRGRMKVTRFAFASGIERTLVFDSGLSTATVSPPAPFDGSATFQRDANGSTSWRGDLSVSLPGAPHTALTGKKFDASLVRPAVGQPGCATAFVDAVRLARGALGVPSGPRR